MFRRNEVLDPAVAAELEALDAALAGERLDVEIALILGEARTAAPTMTPAFADTLERAVASGFGRTGELASAPVKTARARRPRVRLVLAGAAAVVLLGGAGTVLLSSHATNDMLTSSSDDKARPLVATVSSGSAASTTAIAPSSDSAAGGATEVAPESAVAPAPAQSTAKRAAPSSGTTTPGAARKVERAAQLALTTKASDLQEAADGVVRATDRVGGYVQGSEVNAAGRNGYAQFDLRVPADRLQEALAAYSRLASVRSRTQQTSDITSTFNSATERLGDARAERRALLRALAKATTANETASLRARLKLVNSEISRANGDLAAVKRRASYSRVTVTIEPKRAGSAAPAADDGRWTPGDAIGDAGRVLGVAAGVAIVGIAAIAPLAVLLALGLLGTGALRRRRREAALDGPGHAV